MTVTNEKLNDLVADALAKVSDLGTVGAMKWLANHAIAERTFNTNPVALSEYDARKPMSPALQALIESGQVEDGDADLAQPQGQALDKPKGYLIELGAGSLTPLSASQLALPAGPVPEGYKLVPELPTREMAQAYMNPSLASWPQRYFAMLDAAPQPPVPSPAVALPVVNQPEGLQAHLDRSSEIVATWPEWKGGPPKYEGNERAFFEAWASHPFRADKIPLEMHPNGAYSDTRSYLIWYGWKSRAALPAEKGGKS